MVTSPYFNYRRRQKQREGLEVPSIVISIKQFKTYFFFSLLVLFLFSVISCFFSLYQDVEEANSSACLA